MGRGGIALLSLVLAACGGGKWNSLGMDDFSDPASGWPTQDDSTARVAYADGNLEIALKTAITWFSGHRLGLGLQEAVRIQADAVLRKGSRTNDYVGVGCFLAYRGYFFIVRPDGYYAIASDPGRNKDLVTLAEGNSGAVKGFRETNRITGECIGGTSGATLLTLYVNGKQIDQVSDKGGLGSFDSVGLVTGSAGGTVARFDNAAASER